MHPSWLEACGSWDNQRSIVGSHEGTILFLEYNLTDEASQSNFTDQFNILNLQEIFNIEDDTQKESVLVRAGELHRNWRTTLTRDYINRGRSPLDDYTISEEQWEEFKRQRETPEFQVHAITYN